MAVEIIKLGPKAFELSANGTVHRADCERIVPLIKQCIHNHGKVDLLVNISNFKGWETTGLWRSFAIDKKHVHSVTRFSLVAEDTSKKWMALFAKSYTSAKVGFFVQSDLDSARAWVKGK